MDSLVSIYKSMEDASGVNIFGSTNKPSPSGNYSCLVIKLFILLIKRSISGIWL